MTTDAWITLAVLVGVLTVLAFDLVAPTFAMGGGVLVLLLTNVVTESEALGGFGNSAPLTIAALYVLAGAASATGALGGITDKLVGGGGGRRSEIGRLTGGTMAVSAFVPNTPLVALIAPRIVTWCRRTGKSPSQYLMPLSYASVFGGVVTVLGTSTNLVVGDLMAEAGMERFGIFEITPAGLPVALAGVAAMVVVTPWLLKDRMPVDSAMRESARNFTVSVRVDPLGPLPGQTVAEAGLRQLQGVFLVALERDGSVLQVSPDVRLKADDTLYFAGDVGRVIDVKNMAGLVSNEQKHMPDDTQPGWLLFEAVVSERSELAGSTLKEAGFRARYNAAVLAIHRAGEHVAGKMGTVQLRRGDVLLVMADRAFAETWRNRSDFAVIAALDEQPPARPKRSWMVSAAFIGLVVSATFEWLSLMEAALVAAGAMVLLRVISPSEARRSVNMNVVLTIALSISLGTAVSVSGLAEEMARVLGNIGDPFGDIGQLAAVLIATMIITELLSNNGAAAVMFPVAIATATSAGLDPRAFALAVLIGASCSFLSPIGYQTNLMVFGLGGYRFSDFTRLGAPLTLVTIVSTLVVLPIVMPLSG